jgi:hypothetical protein
MSELEFVVGGLTIESFCQRLSTTIEQNYFFNEKNSR